MSDAWQSVWRGQGAAAYFLSPLAGLYCAGWLGYLSIYRFGLKRAYRAKNPIITVGNLRVGGSGKTPMTIYVARTLLGSGRPVVLSASGYGFPRQESASLAPDGLLDVYEWGDEPALLREALPEVPLIVGRDRVAAARLAEEHFPGHVLVMDDGFQHLRLHQPSVVLLDDPRPANRFCLPAGPYREPRGLGRRRAHLVLPGQLKVVRTNCDLRGPTGEPVDDRLEVNVLTAIAQPDVLLSRLSASGYQVVQAVPLPDHDPMSAGTLLNSFPKDVPIVVTSKDWVKIRVRADHAEYQFWIADYEVRVEPESDFREWIEKQLHEL